MNMKISRLIEHFVVGIAGFFALITWTFTGADFPSDNADFDIY